MFLDSLPVGFIFGPFWVSDCSGSRQSLPQSRAPAPVIFTEADRLRGSYGPYRANNDLLYYHLDIRVDPAKQFISGKNLVRFKMLEDGQRIQLDLLPTFSIDKIQTAETKGKPVLLHYERAAGRTVYIDFPKTPHKGKTYAIDFYYSGHPVEIGRSADLSFARIRWDVRL
jgi:hypothetical protein